MKLPAWIRLAVYVPWGVAGIIHPYLGQAGLALQITGLINLTLFYWRNRNENRKID
jgi:hypothetical protein